MAETDQYAGKSDWQVLELARNALLREAALPPGSVQRGIQGLAFDSAMAELNRRAVAQILARIRDADGTGGPGGAPRR